VKEQALVYTFNLFNTPFAKTCHGLLRGSSKYEIVGIVDHKCCGKPVNHFVKNTNFQPEIFSSSKEALKQIKEPPSTFILGIALPGGGLPEEARNEIHFAIKSGLNIISGLHKLLSDDLEFSHWSKQYNVELIDIRKPKSAEELTFWSGAIFDVGAPIISVLGIDCAVGKRTTCRLIKEALISEGVNAQMIYTGQTGWLQEKYGFILDSTLNDFVSGELEKAIIDCDRETTPDIIIVEGQSSLRNPAGPCGSELILSANAKGVILQHAPGREHFLELKNEAGRIPDIRTEVSLIRNYGAEILAITLNEEGLSKQAISILQKELSDEMAIPVINPIVDGLDSITEVIKNFIINQKL
jgi:uncharacterized NAD-dependent epimerase/dehydratase family protein|tara:strand:+ start:2453 stop:3517 length:1065 start_codon:yes stop_codon:yes gene_type:complete